MQRVGDHDAWQLSGQGTRSAPFFYTEQKCAPQSNSFQSQREPSGAHAQFIGRTKSDDLDSETMTSNTFGNTGEHFRLKCSRHSRTDVSTQDHRQGAADGIGNSTMLDWRQVTDGSRGGKNAKSHLRPNSRMAGEGARYRRQRAT